MYLGMISHLNWKNILHFIKSIMFLLEINWCWNNLRCESHKYFLNNEKEYHQFYVTEVSRQKDLDIGENWVSGGQHRLAIDQIFIDVFFIYIGMIGQQTLNSSCAFSRKVFSPLKDKIWFNSILLFILAARLRKITWKKYVKIRKKIRYPYWLPYMVV